MHSRSERAEKEAKDKEEQDQDGQETLRRMRVQCAYNHAQISASAKIV
jgi:hypothetical protein